MTYIPSIINYKPFYIQADKDSVAKDTTEWGLVAKVNPYPILPNPKAPYNNDWNDENGHDEWCEVMHYEPIEFSVSFYIKTFDSKDALAEETMRMQIDAFFSHIKNGEFKIFDSYNGIGRKKVRYAGYSEESFKRRKDWATAIFEVKFKVNDPITRMVLNGGKIVEA